jgi:hypothetical protein
MFCIKLTFRALLVKEETNYIDDLIETPFQITFYADTCAFLIKVNRASFKLKRLIFCCSK